MMTPAYPPVTAQFTISQIMVVAWGVQGTWDWEAAWSMYFAKS